MTALDRPSLPVSPRIRALLLTYGLALFGFGVGIVVLTALATIYLAYSGEITPVAEMGLSLIAMQGIAFPAVSISFIQRRGLDWSFLRTSIPSLRDIGWVILTFILAFLLALLANIVIQSLNLEAASNVGARTAMQNPTIIPYLIIAMFLLVGPGEELLFRGVIQGTLRQYFSPGWAIFLASSAFAPLHIFALIGSLQAGLVTIAVLFIPSLAFGYAYERTENLVVPALAHGFYNSVGLLIIYLAARYGADSQGLLGV